MIFCTQCGTSMRESQKYCWNCGSKADGPATILTPPPPQFAGVPPQNAHAAPARKFGQVFGLDPRVAFLTLIVDMMLNAGDVATLGLLLPVSIGAGIVLGYIVYRAQIGWYGDDPESARIKAIILGLLTAIPTPLPELFYVPAGVVGLWHGFRRKALHQ